MFYLSHILAKQPSVCFNDLCRIVGFNNGRRVALYDSTAIDPTTLRDVSIFRYVLGRVDYSIPSKDDTFYDLYVFTGEYDKYSEFCEYAKNISDEDLDLLEQWHKL